MVAGTKSLTVRRKIDVYFVIFSPGLVRPSRSTGRVIRHRDDFGTLLTVSSLCICILYYLENTKVRGEDRPFSFL